MSEKQSKVLITGGTGFIGKHLCQRLLEEGYILYILTRNKKLNGPGESPVKFYINNLSEIQNIDIDIVINLAGETIAQRWTKNVKHKIYSSRIEKTRDLVNFMRSKKTKPTLLISGSAVGYYGTDSEKTFTEEDVNSVTSSQFASSLCKAWEDEASYAVPLGIRTVLLRIAPVLEKDGGMLAKLLLSFRLGLGSQIGSGHQFLSWIDRDDLIELILFTIHQKNINGPLNAASPNPIRNKEFSLALGKALRRPCFLRIPEFVFKLIFGQMAEEIMLNGQKVLPEKAMRYGFKFSYPTIEKSLSKILRV